MSSILTTPGGPDPRAEPVTPPPPAPEAGDGAALQHAYDLGRVIAMLERADREREKQGAMIGSALDAVRHMQTRIEHVESDVRELKGTVQESKKSFSDHVLEDATHVAAMVAATTKIQETVNGVASQNTAQTDKLGLIQRGGRVHPYVAAVGAILGAAIAAYSAVKQAIPMGGGLPWPPPSHENAPGAVPGAGDGRGR